MIVTAAATLLISLAVFWDTENYWIRNKIMLNKIKELRYEYVFSLSGNGDVKTDELKKYLDKFIGSLGDEYWERYLKDIHKEVPGSESSSKAVPV